MPNSTLDRRTLLQGGAAGLVALTAGASRAEAAPARPPNIVFMMADDLGYADISCYGRPDVSTPNIDRIAANGTRFLQAYANSAVCSATRTALITGRYQYRLPVGLEEPISTHPAGLPPEHPTLPSLLKKLGYGTTLIGKWHLGALPDFGPLKSGYDHFYGFRGGAIDYYLHTARNGKTDFWDEDISVDQHGYSTELLGQRAIEVIGSYAKAETPFLLSLHFNAPHWPWEAPGDEAESERLRGKDPSSFDAGTQATYRGMIRAMDYQIGRVQQALEVAGIADNTILIFTSDNGGERFADTWPFTGRKTELLEGGLRIPAIIAWPGHVPANRTHDQVMITMDWLPTLLAAAGGAPDPSKPSDGINLMPILAAGAPLQSRALFWRYKANWQRAARIGDFKYLKILENTFLFNVVEDPMERANLKERQPDIYKNLVAEWGHWNDQMLPELPETFTENFTGAQMADHIGTRPASKDPDPELVRK